MMVERVSEVVMDYNERYLLLLSEHFRYCLSNNEIINLEAIMELPKEHFISDLRRV